MIDDKASTLISASPPPKSNGSSRSHRLNRRRYHLGTRAKIGVGVAGVFVLVAIIGPWVAPYSPSARTGPLLSGPSLKHLFGTTQTGQDVLSQVLVATRDTLVVGVAAAIVAKIIAIIVGVTAGYLGGAVDDVLSAFTNVFLVLPALPLLIVIAGYLPNKGSLAAILVIGLTGWAFSARILRAQTLSNRGRDYVLSAKAIGEPIWRIVFWELLPNEIAIIASGFLFTVMYAILTQTGLAFLGLVDVSTWTWGTILFWAENDSALSLGAWWWFVPPGLCIALFGTALALINFAMDERINPRLRPTRAIPRKAAPLAQASGQPSLVKES